jgi:hypothetical protein
MKESLHVAGLTRRSPAQCNSASTRPRADGEPAPRRHPDPPGSLGRQGGEDWRRAEEALLPWPPEFPATDADPLGDGVVETLVLRDFATAVRHRTAPDQDVYFGVELSITGIQAMRSSLAGSVPVEVPDLRRREVRRAFAADDWFPDLPDL